MTTLRLALGFSAAVTLLVFKVQAADEMSLLLPAAVDDAAVVGDSTNSRNLINVTQGGKNNSMSLEQSGSMNTLLVSQTGSGGSILVMQSGSGNRASIIQR